MALTLDGNGTIGGLSAGGLPDASVVQADLATGVAGTGPAFSVYPSTTQSISTTTWTKLTFDVEEFDTNNNFASSRFTPTVPGYYAVSGTFNSSTSARMIAAIYKNGSAYKQSADIGYTSSLGASVTSSAIYMNGSTDYLELYAWGGAPFTSASGAYYVHFQAAMVRSA